MIVRTSADAIPQQSRAATGVRLQKLDKGDHLLKVVLVPPEAESDADESSDETSDRPDGAEADAVDAEASQADASRADAAKAEAPEPSSDQDS